MIRLIFSLIYGMIWIAIVLLIVILAGIAFAICAAFPPFIIIAVGIAWWLIYCYKKNLGVKGIQSLFPKFQNKPKARISTFQILR